MEQRGLIYNKNMPILKVFPHGGLNLKFPEHKIVGKESHSVLELKNLISLDGKIRIFKGASRLNTTALGSDVKWQKRIYYQDSGDRKRFTFCVIGGYMYKLDESTNTLNQVAIDGSYSTQINPDFYPIDATIQVSGIVSTFLVDGKYFYKFNGNAAGSWERLPIKTDVDGNTIEPIYITEYLDRLWVLSKEQNVLIGSKNLNPENFNDATDSILIVTPAGNGGFPTALHVHRGYLFVLHEDYFVPLSGSSPATFGIRPGDVIHGFGTAAPRSVVNLKTRFGFLNSEDNEFYSTGGTLDSTDKTPLSDDIELKNLINPVKSHLTVCHLDKNLNILRISYVLSGESSLNAEEIYSLTEKKWCGQTRDRHISCYSQWHGNGDDGRIVTGRSDTGLLMWEDESINFDSTAINFKFVSASYIVDGVSEVQFEEFFIDAKPYGNFAIPLSYYLDTRMTTSAYDNVNMQGEIINLGLIEIADQNYFLNRILPLIDRSKGRMIRFQIEQQATNRLFELVGIYANYNLQQTPSSKYIPGK